MADEKDTSGISLQDLLKKTDDTKSLLENKTKQYEQQRKAAASKFEFDVNTGMAKIQADADSVREILQGYQGFKQIQSHYEQMLAQATAQEQNVRSHPWQNTIAQLAAGIASTDKNPLTAGIGKAATALNPTVDELQARRMAILNQMQQGAGREMHSMLSLSEAARKADMGALKNTVDAFRIEGQDAAKVMGTELGSMKADIDATQKQAGLLLKQKHEEAYANNMTNLDKYRKDSLKIRQDLVAAKGPLEVQAAEKKLETLRKDMRAADTALQNVLTKPPMTDQKTWDERLANMKKNADQTRAAFEEAEVALSEAKARVAKGGGQAGAAAAGSAGKYDKAF